MSSFGYDRRGYGVAFHVHESTCWEVPDNEFDIDVLYPSEGRFAGRITFKRSDRRDSEDVPNVTIEEIKHEMHLRKDYYTDLIEKKQDAYYVPGCERWIAFFWTSCQEKMCGPHDETCIGPYVITDAVPPTYEAINEAIASGELITRPISSLISRDSTPA
jgi:hypothetical protein